MFIFILNKEQGIVIVTDKQTQQHKVTFVLVNTFVLLIF